MEDWESEEFEPAPPSVKEQQKGKWDDEDAEEEDVKESWEDEDTSEAVKSQPPVEKAASKPSGKTGGKKAKSGEGKTREAKETVPADEVLADPVAEKLRQQRLVEEADYRSTTELFARKGDEKTLENFIPKSEDDFLEYAELISHKLCLYDKSFHYIGLLKAVMKLSMTNMKAADAKAVASSITAIANEKLKAEKEANAGKKKQGAKKKQLHVDKPDDDAAVDGYNALDDYDFINSGNVQLACFSLILMRKLLHTKPRRDICIHSYSGICVLFHCSNSHLQINVILSTWKNVLGLGKPLY